MKNFKRILALVLAVLTVMGTMSTGVFAANDDTVCLAEGGKHVAAGAEGFDAILTDTVASTCTTAGYDQYKCNKEGCGKYYVILKPVSGAHKLDDGVVTKAPTCLEDGETVYSCQVCDFKDKVVMPALDHDYNEVLTVKPTATTLGEVVISCNRAEECGYKTQTLTILETCEHNWVTVTADETPSCKDDAKGTHGYGDTVKDQWLKACTYCTKCGNIQGTYTKNFDDMIIAKPEHTWEKTDANTLVKETCEELVYEVKCTNACACGQTKEVRIAKEAGSAQHDWQNVEQSELDTLFSAAHWGAESDFVKKVSKDGWRVYYLGGTTNRYSAYPCETNIQLYRICTRCQDVEVSSWTELGGTIGHVEKVTNNFDCVNGGEKITECVFCHKTETETVAANANAHTVDAKNNTLKYTITKSSTCTAKGTAVYECTNCDYEVAAAQPDLKAHDYVAKEEAANCKYPHKTWKECSVCGDIIDEAFDGAINPDNHKEGRKVVVEATCTTTGLDKVYCIYCDKIDARDEVTPALNHVKADGAKPVKTDAATCGTAGKNYFDCARCNAATAVVEVIPATGKHDMTNLVADVATTCLAEGYKTYACAKCNTTERKTVMNGDFDGQGYQNADGSKLDADAHKFTGATEVLREPTCSIPGLITGFCDVCKKNQTNLIYTTDHKYTVDVKEVPATCTTTGMSAYKTCEFCGAEDGTKTVIKMKDHSYVEVTTAPLAYRSATCSAFGRRYWKCETCDIYKVTDYQKRLSETGAHVWDTENPLYIQYTSATLIGYRNLCEYNSIRVKYRCKNADCSAISDTQYIGALGHLVVIEPDDVKNVVTLTNNIEITYRDCNEFKANLTTALKAELGKAFKDELVDAVIKALGTDLKCEREAEVYGTLISIRPNYNQPCRDEVVHTVVTKTLDATCQTAAMLVEHCKECGVIFVEKVTGTADATKHDLTFEKMVYTAVQNAADRFVTIGNEVTDLNGDGNIGFEDIVCGGTVDVHYSCSVEGCQGVVVSRTAWADDTNRAMCGGNGYRRVVVKRPTMHEEGTVAVYCVSCNTLVRTEAINKLDYNFEFLYEIKHADSKFVADDLDIVNSGLIELTIKTNVEELDLYSIALRLNYNPKVLTFVQAGVKNTTFEEFDTVNTVKENSAYVTLYATPAVDITKKPENITIKGEEVFVKLYFKVNADVTPTDAKEIAFTVDSFSEIVKIDENGKSVALTEANDKVMVGVGDTVASADVHLLGDLNDDRTVKSSDLLAFQMLVAQNGMTVTDSQADINKDGILNVIDYSLLRSYINGSKEYLDIVK